MMKKRIVVALLAVLCTACGMIAVRHASAVHTASSVCDGALYAISDGEPAVFDSASRSFSALPVRKSVYDMCSAGGGSVWMLAEADDGSELLLWSGGAVARTIPLDFRPLAMRAYQNGILLVCRHSWVKLTPYLKQGLSMLGVTADIMYLDTDTLQLTKKTECAYPQMSDHGTFFAVYGDTFTFLPPTLQQKDTGFICDDHSVCVCSADGEVREFSLPQKAGIRDLCSTTDGFAAVGKRGLYAFSAESGTGDKLLSRRNILSGVYSSDGKQYFYIKKTGLFGDKECLYAVRLSDGCTVRLWHENNVADDVSTVIYFL